MEGSFNTARHAGISANTEEVIRPLVPDYPMNLVEGRKIPKEIREKLTSDFRLMAEYAVRRQDPELLEELLEDKFAEDFQGALAAGYPRCDAASDSASNSASNPAGTLQEYSEADQAFEDHCRTGHGCARDSTGRTK